VTLYFQSCFLTYVQSEGLFTYAHCDVQSEAQPDTRNARSPQIRDPAFRGIAHETSNCIRSREQNKADTETESVLLAGFFFGLHTAREVPLFLAVAETLSREPIIHPGYAGMEVVALGMVVVRDKLHPTGTRYRRRYRGLLPIEILWYPTGHGYRLRTRAGTAFLATI